MFCDFLCVFTVSEKDTWVFIHSCWVSGFQDCPIQANQTFLPFQYVRTWNRASWLQHVAKILYLQYMDYRLGGQWRTYSVCATGKFPMFFCFRTEFLSRGYIASHFVCSRSDCLAVNCITALKLLLYKKAVFSLTDVPVRCIVCPLQCLFWLCALAPSQLRISSLFWYLKRILHRVATDDSCEMQEVSLPMQS